MVVGQCEIPSAQLAGNYTQTLRESPDSEKPENGESCSRMYFLLVSGLLGHEQADGREGRYGIPGPLKAPALLSSRETHNLLITEEEEEEKEKQM